MFLTIEFIDRSKMIFFAKISLMIVEFVSFRLNESKLLNETSTMLFDKNEIKLNELIKFFVEKFIIDE